MTEHKFTDEEVIKALKCCIKTDHFGDCFGNDCPFVSEHGCRVGKETLYPYVLDLINRQKAEIERLTLELAGMRGAANLYKIHYENAKSEVAREIFAETEEAVAKGFEYGTFFDVKRNIIELKKKYIAREQDSDSRQTIENEKKHTEEKE